MSPASTDSAASHVFCQRGSFPGNPGRAAAPDSASARNGSNAAPVASAVSFRKSLLSLLSRGLSFAHGTDLMFSRRLSEISVVPRPGGDRLAAMAPTLKSESTDEDLRQRAPSPDAKLDAALFRRKLMSWYKSHARELPWRGISDPYRTWLSEVMLRQTRVGAVVEHYEDFLRKFPTILALALAPEPEVLATWSGLGYYRRARMMHKTAQFLTRERAGVLPSTAAELRTLPGIGEYTSAAIASIAFGESIAVVDGNVERVLLRLTGRPQVKTAAGRAFVQAQANALVPRRRMNSQGNAAGD